MKIRLKILFTVIAGGLTYLLTNVTSQPEIWQLTMSVFVGGIVLVVQILIEAAEQSRRTAEIVTEMDRATALFTLTDEALGKKTLTNLVKSAARIDRREDLRLRFANQQVERLTDLFDGLDRGWAEYEGEDRDWLLGLTDAAARSIDATSMASLGGHRSFVDEGLWTSDLGLRYLDRQRKAIDRGVRIRRLFLLDETDTPANAIDDEKIIGALLEPHKKIHVETRVIRSRDLDFLILANLADFILFDDKVSYELHSAPSMGKVRPVIASTTLVVTRSRVEERRQRFESMWAMAEEL